MRVCGRACVSACACVCVKSYLMSVRPENTVPMATHRTIYHGRGKYLLVECYALVGERRVRAQNYKHARITSQYVQCPSHINNYIEKSAR